MSSLSLRLPDSLHRKIRELAKEEGISINQFITTALAEKLSAIEQATPDDEEQMDHLGRVTVFHMFKKPRYWMGLFLLRGGFTSDKQRDRAMTKVSNEDIAWVRPGREKSGTAQNLKRRTPVVER